VEPKRRRIGLVGRLFGSHVPKAAAGPRARLSGVLDTLVLDLAIAAPGESGEIFDPEYAEAMVLVFDEYFRRQSRNRHAVWASAVGAESVPQGIHDESFAY
jgi:hypothetical protein